MDGGSEIPKPEPKPKYKLNRAGKLARTIIGTGLAITSTLGIKNMIEAPTTNASASADLTLESTPLQEWERSLQEGSKVSVYTGQVRAMPGINLRSSPQVLNDPDTENIIRSVKKDEEFIIKDPIVVDDAAAYSANRSSWLKFILNGKPVYVSWSPQTTKYLKFLDLRESEIPQERVKEFAITKYDRRNHQAFGSENSETGVSPTSPQIPIGQVSIRSVK